MPIDSYIQNIARRYALGNATEHTFRGDLQRLIEELVPDVAATNEPKRIECGAPDYVLSRQGIPIGYVEAKDVGVDLTGKPFKEQYDRYREALDNLAFTDYLDFRFYSSGQRTAQIKIGEVRNGSVVPLAENFDQFRNLLKDFCSRTPVTIKSSKRLAEMMADKAKILAYIIRNALEEDKAANVESDLTGQLKAFKDILIHDIDARAFADIYAQTIAYGMFAARLHDPNLETFSRQEAAHLIPKTNPFLRKLFQFIAAFDLDTRIDWIVDALADLFRATDIAAILKNFGKSTQTHDPIMHFYETFLAEYDPKLRKSRGVFYTPEPVVDFIVRAVDDILKSEFNLPNGLADTSTTKIKVDVQGKLREREVHKVQILDPATGTGTFLASVIKHIHKRFEGQQGIWDQYVDEHVIPRLNGFELLMASYAMAHLKLDLLLTELSAEKSLKGTEIIAGGKAEGRNPRNLSNHETDPEGVAQNEADVAPLQGVAALGDRSPGFHPGLLSSSPSGTRDQRFQVYLTNSLEEYHPDTGTLFASWLSTEANEANHIKRDTPVMVVIGNPPYSGESKNKGDWIMSLMEDYKVEPNTSQRLQEKNSKFLNDDYVKFIRYAQYFVEKNGDGVLAYINNHGFLDNPTFRGMRWNLLKTFDKIYVIDLHGNTKKKEVAPDGSLDKNVFDIQPGVSINLFIRNRGKKNSSKLATVYHAEQYGSREVKLEYLWKNALSSIQFNKIESKHPQYFFMDKGVTDDAEYKSFFGIADIFGENSLGVLSKNDSVTIDFQRDVLSERINDFRTLEAPALKSKYSLKDDSRDWSLSRAVTDLRQNYSETHFKTIEYRPFDKRWTFFTGTPRGFFAYSQNRIMRNIRNDENFCLVTGRTGEAVGMMQWNLAFIANSITDQNIFYRGGGTALPLYLYPDENAQPTLDGRTERVANLNGEIVDKMAAAIGLTFTNEREEADNTFAPIDILDYIYAVLHSPSYREKYKEFLKIDFPRVPYPKDAETFWKLVAPGGELRQIHLLESPKVNAFITGYPVGGSNSVTKIEKRGDKVYINPIQHFSGVPTAAWNFYIGGYQPAQKWLKDRKGRTLNYDDIQHYQKIIVALTETDRLMREVDKVLPMAE